MAKKKRKKRKTTRKRNDDYPGWVWMLFGLAIGLSVAVAIYVKDRPAPTTVVNQPESSPRMATAPAPTLDDNREKPAPAATTKTEERFAFYEMLKKMEVVVDASPREAKADNAPQAVVEPGSYMLQAGSFSTNADADRRRAELAMQGIESHVHKADVHGKTYHRVYIGPLDDLDELNMIRSRLRAARIDVLRYRLAD